MSLYPLKFKPRFVEKIWGGRKLETVFGKLIPADKPIGESWELYDFPPGICDNTGNWTSAAVAEGPLAGRTLHQLIEQFGPDLLGSAQPVGPHKQFPLLIKFLDAREDLSVQVHPDEKYAAENDNAHLKTEAWYVIQNDPGARLLKGLAPGTTKDHFHHAIHAGTVEQHIQAIPVKPGQCFYLPSGTVHALGAGILVAEVQTPSDTTFRVFDFNRVEPATGKPRTLHVDQAMACIDFTGSPEADQPRTHVAGLHTTVSRLVTSPYFKIEKVRFADGVEQPVASTEPTVWIMLEGHVQLTVKNGPTVHAHPGDTLLLPAVMDQPKVKTLNDCVWLEATF